MKAKAYNKVPKLYIEHSVMYSLASLLKEPLQLALKTKGHVCGNEQTSLCY